MLYIQHALEMKASEAFKAQCLLRFLHTALRVDDVFLQLNSYDTLIVVRWIAKA